MFGMKKDINKELIKFSTKGKIDKVRTLLQSGADVNCRDEKGWTSAHWASARGYMDVLDLLIKEGSELTAISNNGLTLLHVAAWYGRKDMVAFLIKEIEVNVVSNEGFTPLQMAAAGLAASAEGKQQIATVEFLIDSGASVSSKDVAGCTPLHSAAGCAQTRTKIIRLLIEREADINAQQMDGATPLHFAARTGDSNNVWELLHKKADRNIRTNDGRIAQQVASLSVTHCF